LYGEVVVPPEVYREITRETDLPGSQELKTAAWLSEREVHDQAGVQRLLFWLDRGESEAIVLAQAMGSTLLIGERWGRMIAQALGLNRTGVVGILLAAKAEGQISVVTPLLDALLTAGVRLSPRLYEEARHLAGET
jgi:hypothetical protein